MNIKLNIKKYMNLHNYTYEEAVEKVLEEAQNHINNTDELLSEYVKYVPNEELEKITGKSDNYERLLVQIKTKI